MDDMDAETGAQSTGAALRNSGLRFGGLLLFISGTVAVAQLFAHGGGLPWIALAAAATIAGLIAMALGLRGELMAGRTKLTTPERSRLRFDQWHGLWVLGYVLSFIFGLNTVPNMENVILRGVLITLPLVMLGVMISEFIRMIIRSDEHQRAQHVTASAVGAGGLVVALGAWSTLGELLGGWPSPPGWTLIPAFVVIYVIALSILNRGEA